VRATLLFGVALAGLALTAASGFLHVRKRLIAERQAVNAEWLEVDQALTRRADLIPSLEESLKSLPDPAGVVFADLNQARANLQSGRSPAEKFAANDRLSYALSRLLLLTESHPKPRSTGKLARLEEDLEGAENHIAVERRKYNETLEHYNSSIQMFPENVVAALSGFARNDNYFHTSQGLEAGTASPPRP
jgi:LemA protein